MILDDICTILEPKFDESGLVSYAEFGDFFCSVDRKPNGFKGDGPWFTHVAKMVTDGISPGCKVITQDGIFSVVHVKEGMLGLVFVRGRVFNNKQTEANPSNGGSK
jgi:hypothetical protein